MSIEDLVHRFIKESSQFQLGGLPTEQPHPLTRELSNLSQTHLGEAIDTFKQVEILAFERTLNSVAHLENLKKDVLDCLQQGHRIFFCGCGATGRLSVALESLWREVVALEKPELRERVQGFIAGGDFALVKSIENFEDHPEYGARQLLELGFTKNDLLVSCTEGGETPFVIGATLKAAEVSIRSPYFLFCNPRSSLQNIQRSQEVFNNKKIKSISLEVGNMAICGSTRLQASSVLYAACAIPLLSYLNPSLNIFEEIKAYIDFLVHVDFQGLKALIDLETHVYQNSNFLTYHTQHNSLGILTDLTERSPTFSLRAVENKLDVNARPAQVNLLIESAQDSQSAWKQIIGRAPINLKWPELQDKFSDSMVLGFDYSHSGFNHRKKLIGPNREHHQVFIKDLDQVFQFKSDTFDFGIAKPEGPIQKQLLLKILMNTISSLAMCKNHRVLGNVMLYVRPSNKKLIDRAARYVQEILIEQHDKTVSYKDAVHCIYLLKEDDSGDESVVLKAVNYLK